jgi:spermidine synthase
MARVDVVIGDGRTLLERETDQQFDTLVLDAFSGDSVPVHLLTTEAFACYFRRLAPGGVLAIHISNDYLDLAPVVQAAARAHGRQAWIIQSPENPGRRWLPASWAIVSDDDQFTRQLEKLPTATRAGAPGNSFRAWTDRYSNLLAALK